MEFKKTDYTLKTVLTGREFDDNGWVLADSQSPKPSLIRAIYSKKQIEFKDPSYGLYRFSDWLPVSRMLEGSSYPITYRSEALANKLSLKNLYITFSGYFPKIGANMRSCSFKETEAYSVCGRLSKEQNGVMVVSSAGNTARAFARVCSENNIPIIITIPYDNLDAMWFDKPLNPCVKVFATASGSDYFDAIALGNEIVKLDGFYAEGGATNIARRDGMSTTMLSAVEKIGEIPDYYFQAVGSGTGAIAAWEANMRLIEDGRFGDKKCKLMVSQNAPFLLMYNSWKQNSRDLVDYETSMARKDAVAIDAKVLSNRKPPYSVAGGLYDALVDTKGDIFDVSNNDLRQAQELFQELEGIDIHPAAAVAVKSLIDCVENGTIDKDATVMLNITGGGEQLFKKENKTYSVEPCHVFPIDFTEIQVAEVISRYF